MSDKLDGILDAIDTVLTAQRASGESLAAAKYHKVERIERPTPKIYGYPMPCIYVDPLPVSAEIISIPACMTDKTAQVRFRVFDKYYREKEHSTAFDLLDAVENNFIVQTFGVAEWADVVSKSYALPAIEPTEEPTYIAAELIMQYRYIDVRAVPTQGV